MADHRRPQAYPLPGSDTPADSPGGYGAATFTNNIAGTAVLAGTLGDGTSLNSQSVPISAEGIVPVYVPLYLGQGSIFGWLTFSNVPPQTVSGDLTWFKLSGPAHSLYTNGFTNQTGIIGSVYVPSNTNILALTNGTLTISNSGQGISLVYTNVNVISNKLTYTAPPTNQLIVTFTPGRRHDDGELPADRGEGQHYGPGSGVAGFAGRAVAQGRRWFLGTNQSGYFILTH